MWKLRDSTRLRLAAAAVRNQGTFVLSGSPVPLNVIADWLDRAALQFSVQEEREAALVGPIAGSGLAYDTVDSASRAALDFARALPVVVEHRKIVTDRTPPGAELPGTHVACTCLFDMGIVSRESPDSPGSRKEVETAYRWHLQDVAAGATSRDESD